MTRNFLAILAFVFLSAISTISQEARSEASVQATGFFTKDSDGQGISQKTTQSAGVLAGYRYRINRWFSAEGDYGYNLKFFQIEWRMDLMIDLQLASQMPLIQQ